jgi:hypothetical protein
LWWAGDPAQSVAVVEAGRLGIRDGGQIVDVVPKGAALGESALLAHEAPQSRGVDVVALDEGTVVLEHPVGDVREPAAAELRVRLLRTLLGQTARNYLQAAAAHRDHALMATAAVAAIETLSRCEAQLDPAASWDDFLLGLRFLGGLRAGSDVARRDLAEAWNAAVARGLLDRVQPPLAGSWLAAYLADSITDERSS